MRGLKGILAKSTLLLLDLRQETSLSLAKRSGHGVFRPYKAILDDPAPQPMRISGDLDPWLRGVVCGAMTALGGIGHTIPFLISKFTMAMGVAIFIVVIELGTITWIRHKYMDTATVSAALQVAVGGALVFLAGLLIGSA